MVNIALFGTSADPPTSAHQAILNWLSYHYDHVAVWASDNPFKTHQTPLEHRSTMLRLLIEDISPPRRTLVSTKPSVVPEPWKLLKKPVSIGEHK
jgi:nicotinate-nucleotide adenylyltransferase